MCIADNFTGVEYHTSMHGLKSSEDQLVDLSVCKNHPVLKLRQDNDKTFKIMLTLVGVTAEEIRCVFDDV